MKRNAILLSDIIAAFIVIEWSLYGPWDRLLGYNFYHSRGDVWLPTPVAAADFFRGMVSTGTALFLIIFLLTSCMIFVLGRPRGASADEKGGVLYELFFGDASKLTVKYSAFLLVSFISPFFYGPTLRFHYTRSGRIADGLAMSLVALVIVFVIAGLAARIAPSRRPAPSF